MTPKKDTGIDGSIENLNARIQAWAAEAPKLRADTEALLAKIKLARGTREIAPVSRGAYTVGDAGPTPELAEAVLRLCVEQPRRRHDLTDMTGARETRVSGVLKTLQETGYVRNTGDARRAVWVATAKGRAHHRSAKR